MTKYNLSSIMKRAWELVKKAGMTISDGLKYAWFESKNQKISFRGSEKQVAWAKDIVKDAKETIEKVINFYAEDDDPNLEKELYAANEIKKQFELFISNRQKASNIIELRKAFEEKSIHLMISEYSDTDDYSNLVFSKIENPCIQSIIL